jgi:acyl dehydratase
MSAIMSASISSAMFADQYHAQRMPSAKHGMWMASAVFASVVSAASAATASIRIIETGVIVPVSFVASLSLILTLVLISLILSGLAGLDGTGLVGLIGKTLSQSIAKGD